MGPNYLSTFKSGSNKGTWRSKGVEASWSINEKATRLKDIVLNAYFILLSTEPNIAAKA